MTKNMLSFTGSQTVLASENEFNFTGNFHSMETVGDARRLGQEVYRNGQRLSPLPFTTTAALHLLDLLQPTLFEA